MYLGNSHTYESHSCSQVLARTPQAERRPSLHSECPASVSPLPTIFRGETRPISARDGFSSAPPRKVPGPCLVSLESPGSYLIIPKPPGLRPLRVQCPQDPVCSVQMLSVSRSLYLGLGLCVVPWRVWSLCPSLRGACAEPVVCCSCPLFPTLRSPILVPGTHKVIGDRAVAVFKGAGLRHTPPTTLSWLGLVRGALQEE